MTKYIPTLPYEILPEIKDEEEITTLHDASFTPNNSIRINLTEFENSDEHNSTQFDFTPEQALLIGQALIRWGTKGHPK